MLLAPCLGCIGTVGAPFCVQLEEGVLFVTYSALARRSSRLDQVVEWCGGRDFEGLLVFDEIHRAKNLIPVGGARASLAGLKTMLLQLRLPSARVVYCSATGATEAHHFGPMSRLGLWAREPGVRGLEDLIERGGRPGDWAVHQRCEMCLPWIKQRLLPSSSEPRRQRRQQQQPDIDDDVLELEEQLEDRKPQTPADQKPEPKPRVSQDNKPGVKSEPRVAAAAAGQPDEEEDEQPLPVAQRAATPFDSWEGFSDAMVSSSRSMIPETCARHLPTHLCMRRHRLESGGKASGSSWPCTCGPMAA